MDYSIIIPAYNEEDYLSQTLASVQSVVDGMQGQKGEVIVVNNNSDDKTAEIAKSFGVKVVFEPQNHIARARNAGAKHAKGRVLIFVDADTLLTTSLVESAFSAIEAGASGGGALIQLDQKASFLMELPLHGWNAFSRLAKIGAGCFVFCLKEAFNDIGGFDERVYATEEAYFFMALRKWSKRQGRFIQIITTEKVVSSARKFETHAWYEVLLLFVLLPFFPLLARFQKSTHFWWYNRRK